MAAQGQTPAFGGLDSNQAAPASTTETKAPASKTKAPPAAQRSSAREIAYREVPPLLEDSAIEGPYRVSVPNALDHWEDREAIQADRSWFRYSGCAFPFLVSLFFLTVVLFALTLLQGNLNFQGMRHGIPRVLVEKEYSSENDHEYEGGNRKIIRDLRWSTTVTYFVAAVFFFLMPKSMKMIGALGGAVLIFISAIIGLVLFLFAVHALDDVSDCNRMQWLPLKSNLRMTQSSYVQCTESDWETAFQANVVMTFTDAALLIISLVCAPLIIIWSLMGKAWVRFNEPENQAMRAEGHAPEREMRIRRALGWKDSNFEDPNGPQYDATRLRDAELERAYPMRNVSSFRRNFITLVFTVVGVLTLFNFIVSQINHEHRWEQSVRGRVMHDGYELEKRPQSVTQLKNFVPNGNRHEQAEHPGWPIKNTNVRMATTCWTILAILFVMIPWRSATINHLFGFGFFCLAWMYLACFIFDVKTLGWANDNQAWIGDPPFSTSLPNGNFQSWPANEHTKGHEAARVSESFTEAESKRGAYIMVCVLDIILFLLFLVYFILEHLRLPGLWSRCEGQCEQDFSILELAYHKKYECSKRLVTCEYCRQSYNADQFVHQHRFECPEDELRCTRCMSFVPEWARAEHEKDCLQVAVKCGMCDDLFMRYDMPRHVVNCKNKPQACSACGEVYRAGQMADHQERCPAVMVPCHACGAVMRRSQLVHHSQFECPMRSGHYDAAHGL